MLCLLDVSVQFQMFLSPCINHDVKSNTLSNCTNLHFNTLTALSFFTIQGCERDSYQSYINISTTAAKRNVLISQLVREFQEKSQTSLKCDNFMLLFEKHKRDVCNLLSLGVHLGIMRPSTTAVLQCENMNQHLHQTVQVELIKMATECFVADCLDQIHSMWS